MATGVSSWSTTIANNATADSNAQWPEGMAPSSVNDAARGLMSSVAKWRNDISGANTTGGSSTAYTLTTQQSFASLAAMNAQIITFVPHTTNGADPTLAVDGLTAKQIRSATGTNVASGTLVSGTPYAVIYFSSAAEFILLGFSPDPYNIPIGGLLDYAGTTAPNSNFALAYGQAVSRTTYATLFALVGTTFGTGDGSTTFNLPDCRGRVVAGKDDMGGSSANRLTNQTGGLDGDTLGATGGAETVTLDSTMIPSHTHSASVTDSGHTHVFNPTFLAIPTTAGGVTYSLAGGVQAASQVIALNSATTGITVSNSNTGGGGAHNNVQPTIILAKIIRLI